MSIQDLLNQLDRIFETLGINEKLADPISKKELAHFAESLPFRIPTDLESLYRWHNGIVEFIPAYNLLSFADAVSEYQELVAVAEYLQDENFFKKTHFPILQFQDYWLVIDCEPTSEANIYDVFLESGYTRKEYKNLKQMLQVVVDAYLSRAYYIEDESLQENSVLLQKIKNKYLSQKQRDERESAWKTLSCEADRLLISQDWGRHYFMSRLSQFNDERAIDYLLNFLKDSDPEVIAHAALGLGELKARETLPELIKLLKHPVEMVRNLSAHAIAGIISQEDKVLVQPLIELLTDKKTLVRIAAIEALAQLKSPKAVSPLIELLNDSNTGVRYRVIQALARTGDTRALEALRRWKSKASSNQEIQTIDQAISRMENLNL